ncbi:hypothetical protein K474DRAFT_1610489, partial [Panus rudis PR-1116 ss-1]
MPPTTALKREIISDWQQTMDQRQGEQMPCAVCAIKLLSEAVCYVHSKDVDLTLLQNKCIPVAALPRDYNFDAYGQAILHWRGLLNPLSPGVICLCATCETAMVKNRTMPKHALANFLYYGREALPSDVQDAFKHATSCELLLVARARASKISFRFSELKDHALSGTEPYILPRCIKGNVLILPQESARLQTVLPPSRSEIMDTVCAVFVGATQPSKETIARLRPVLVRKSRVEKMINFLVANNPEYTISDTFSGLSRHNLDALFTDSSRDEGVLAALHIGHIVGNEATWAATGDYGNRSHIQLAETDEGVVLENVGYMAGSDTPEGSTQLLKYRALNHCLGGGRFIHSQAGSRALPDFRNPSLLTMLYPHLDPWGIGGFDHPKRQVTISFEDQLRHILLTWDSPFQTDPAFSFVYYNILQKRMVSRSVRFRVPASTHQRIVRELLAVDGVRLEALTRRFQIEPHYEPTDPRDTRIVRLLRSVRVVNHEIPGSAAHKLTLRNQIRGLINYIGTPTLFVTLNPSDVHHPLVRILAADSTSVEECLRGVSPTEWERRRIAAINPGACALFFDHMM